MTETISPTTIYRFQRGDTVTVRSALLASAHLGTTIDIALGLPSRPPLPARFRKRPLTYVLRALQVTQAELAGRAKISASAVCHATAGDDVSMSTVTAIAAALNYPAQDVAELIVTPPETLTPEELENALTRAPSELTKTEKAGRLGVTINTLNRWLNGKRAIPAGLREELVSIGWLDEVTTTVP